jgi:hypothetical protein
MEHTQLLLLLLLQMRGVLLCLGWSLLLLHINCLLAAVLAPGCNCLEDCVLRHILQRNTADAEQARVREHTLSLLFCK